VRDMKLAFGKDIIEVPAPEGCQAIFQRMTGPDGKGGYRSMTWDDLYKYGRLGNPGNRRYQGTYHEGRDLLPLP